MANKPAQTILVIDDDMSVQIFMTQSLKNAGASGEFLEKPFSAGACSSVPAAPRSCPPS